MPLVEVYDTVLIPALAMAETHWQRGEINEDRHKLIFQSLKETVEELGEREPGNSDERRRQGGERAGWRLPSSLASTNASSLRVLCLPARDEADEIAGTMLAQLLADEGVRRRGVSVTSLASEMVDLVEQRKADVVCISAMPPRLRRMRVTFANVFRGDFRTHI